RVAFHMAILGANAHRALVSGLMTNVIPMLVKHGSSMDVAQKQAGAIFGMLASRQALVLAYQDCFFAAGVVSLLGILPALFIERRIGVNHGPSKEAHAIAIAE
ncbi:MAG: hypothetical protein KGR26_16480, partial [Cyanobacteria bacterium REEB65]|nr:hypothetical protein [Cyanobacteria bacterium REEB65]